MHAPLEQTARYGEPVPAAYENPYVPGAALRLRVVESAAELAALAPHWEHLHAQAQTTASIFNSWAWQSTWWRLYGRDRPLRVLVARRGEAVAGILPLYIETGSHFGLPVRVLRLVGDGGDTHPDDLGPLLAPGEETELGAALARAMLHLPGFDVAQLNEIDPGADFPAAVAAAAEAAELRHVLQPSVRIVYVRLARDWPTFLARLSGNRRSQLRRKRAKLAATFATRFFIWGDAARLPEALLRLAELHRKRWGDATESFSTLQYLEIHFAAMRAALARGELRLYCLELAGEIAAMLYAYRLHNRIYVVQAGFDPTFARWSPGYVLLDYALEHAIGEGNEVFDFLRGEHEYKERIATGRRETLKVSVFRPTVGAAAYRARHVYAKQAKAKLRELARSMAVF
jgi:CelD/BcsL family acetyltransferase involved in cellulose biosynthesis